jgi:hypothetical protein
MGFFANICANSLEFQKIAGKLKTEDLQSYYSNILSYSKQILRQNAKVQELDHIAQEFEALKTSIEKMYFRLKTELWQYKVHFKISADEFFSKEAKLFGKQSHHDHFV